jgi:hypothetical protein
MTLHQFAFGIRIQQEFKVATKGCINVDLNKNCLLGYTLQCDLVVSAYLFSSHINESLITYIRLPI